MRGPASVRIKGPAMDYLAVLKSSIVALIGVCFFFAIIGVFGLSTSIVSLIVFVVVALWTFGRRQHFPDAE
jgi:Na+/H+-translocating membrane pyrophosphatase